MRAKTISSNQFFKFLSIIFFGLLLGQIVLAIVAYLLINMNIVQGSKELEQVFYFLIPSFILIGFFGSNYLFKILLSKINIDDEINLKHKAYFNAIILKYALLESGGIFAFIAVILTGNYVFLVFSGIVILLFIFNKPSQTNQINDLKLNQTEIDYINNNAM